MTTNFYLDSKKSDNNTKAVICFIRGLVKSKTTYIKTNIKIEPELWCTFTETGGVLSQKWTIKIIIISLPTSYRNYDLNI